VFALPPGFFINELSNSTPVLCLEYFYGSGVAGQLIQLHSVPLLPLRVEYFDATNPDVSKQDWVLLRDGQYAIVEGTREIIVTPAIPVAAPPPSNKNLRVFYYPISSQAVANSLSAVDPVTGAYTTLTLEDVDPVVDVDLLFSPNTGKGEVTRIVITRRSVLGVPYTGNSRTVEVFDTTIGPPVSDGVHSLFLDSQLEPDGISGRLVNRSDKVLGHIEYVNTDPTELGHILLRMTAEDGDADSVEVYDIRIQGHEEQ
jgi:hypothetical protein